MTTATATGTASTTATDRTPEPRRHNVEVANRIMGHRMTKARALANTWLQSFGTDPEHLAALDDKSVREHLWRVAQIRRPGPETWELARTLIRYAVAGGPVTD